MLFKDQIVGIAVPASDLSELQKVYQFLRANRGYTEFFASFGSKYLIGRQAALLKKSIEDLPYPEGGKITFRGVQKYLRDDVIEFMIPLIKDVAGTHQRLSLPAEKRQVETYAKVFVELMHSAYPDFRSVHSLELKTSWCVAFQKGDGMIANVGSIKDLEKNVESLLSNHAGKSLRTYRIIRHFSGNTLFIIKPKPLRYWLKSVAVSDADAVFAWVMKRTVKKRRAMLAPVAATF